MMVSARQLDVSADEVRYAFGFEDRFDRVLLIHPGTLEAHVTDAMFDAAAGAIAGKIVRTWRATGQWPVRIMFAS